MCIHFPSYIIVCIQCYSASLLSHQIYLSSSGLYAGPITITLLLQTKLNALACIDRLVDSLDKMMILDEVLPFLTDIPCQDVDIIMSVIGA